MLGAATAPRLPPFAGCACFETTGYGEAMSYRTLEVELDRGQVCPCGSETLPEKARALLTILAPAPAPSDSVPTASLAELVGDLAGIGQGKHTDLSTNKTHLADFDR